MSDWTYCDKVEAGKYLGGICTRQLDYWTAKGELAFIRCGKRKLFRKVDLDEFMESRRQPARSETQG